MDGGFALHEVIYDSALKAIDYKIINTNPAFEKHVGIPAEKARDALATQLYGVSPAPFLDIYLRVAETSEPNSFQTYFQPLDKHFEISVFSPKPGYFATIFTDITERKHAEEQINQLSQAVEQSPNTVVITDLKGDIEYVNPKFSATTGYSFEEALGKNPRILKSGELPAEQYKILWDTITSGNEWRGEFHNKKKNGELYWELASISPIKNKEGIATHFLAVKEEITARKQAEETLRVTNAKHSAMIENIGDVIAIMGPDGIIKYQSPNIEKWLGWKPEEIIGTSSFEKVHPEDIKRIQKEFSKTLETDSPLVVEFRHKCKDGTYKWIELAAANHINDPAINGVLVNFHDITERKQAEKKLRESEERFRRLFNDLGDAVFVTKIGGTDSAQILEVNPAAEKQTGYTRDHLLKMNIVRDLNIADSSESPLDEWDEALVKGQKVISVEKKRKKDGTEYWTQVVLTPIDFKGEKACLSVNHDITKRKLVEIALKKSEIQLQELNTTKDKLFSIIAHDLRSPFNSILGFSNLLSDNEVAGDIEKTVQYGSLINSTAKSTLGLLNNLLDWAKSQSGQIDFKPKKINYLSIIQEIIETSELAAITKNISLNHFQSDEIELFANENIVKTVLRNLISNAIKFTNLNGKIDIYAVKEDNFITITVSDNGVGMNDETRNSLFNISSYITTKGTAGEKGSGLGLVLCKEFVEKLGGKIWVESELGKGSNFKFTLPLSQ